MRSLRQFPSIFRPTILSIAALFLAAGLAGCGGQRDEIDRYTVLKEEVVEARNPGSYPDRMLGAMIRHGDAFWFFKVVGPIEAVDRHRNAFLELIESVQFDADSSAKSETDDKESADAKSTDAKSTDAQPPSAQPPTAPPSAPSWKLPAGWTEQREAQSPNRFATISIPDGSKPLELTVTTMPARGEDDQLVWANVNRWRNQMGLNRFIPIQIQNSIERLKLSDGSEALLVDLKGKFTTTSMPPFAMPRAGGPAS